MILSVSRRTDIPQYYSDWFFNRMNEGYLYVRNPMNSHQVSRIDLDRSVVDFIVFWSKNPEPMLARLDEIGDIPYYVQMTLTGYGSDIEPGTADKAHLIKVFCTLADRIGPERMVWRYDPVFMTDRYTLDFHKAAFDAFAGALAGRVNKVVISFLDLYGKTVRNMNGIAAHVPDETHMMELGAHMVKTASALGMTVESCAEAVDLRAAGISPGSCIDPRMIEAVGGCPISASKDKNQRLSCGCIQSVEVGTYDTCRSGCRYCYANDSTGAVKLASGLYDPREPLLCGRLNPGDKVTVRKVESIRTLL